MKIWSNSFAHGEPIPGQYAFCVPDAEAHVTFAPNENPHLAWREVPVMTRSLALICYDSDVPSVGDDVNQEGREVPADLPRVDFAHWILLDMPIDRRSIAAGAHSQGVVARGKPGPEAPEGLRHGLNDYTGWFAGDPDMGGDYYGYDGPCPPWNDSIIHHYHFELLALKVETLRVEGPMTLANVRKAMEGIVLARTEIVGTYTLNPRLRG